MCKRDPCRQIGEGANQPTANMSFLWVAAMCRSWQPQCGSERRKQSIVQKLQGLCICGLYFDGGLWSVNLCFLEQKETFQDQTGLA